MLPEPADRSTPGHEVVRNSGLVRPDSATIILTVVAITAAAHTARNAVRLEDRLVILTRVRTALVGVVQKARIRGRGV